MKSILVTLVTLGIFSGCQPIKQSQPEDQLRAGEIKSEFLRSWNAYKTYAWGHDVLLPISKSYMDWYEHPLGISPIDAYSTMKIMGLDEEAAQVQKYVTDTLDFDRDQFVKTFEVNIRVLGGLVAMYQFTGDKKVLAKAEDFGKRLLPAYTTGTGIPAFWVNLRTGEIKGDTVNLAEGGSSLMEMGMLSRFSGNPVYFEAAKKASLAIFNRRSSIGLVGENIDVQTGQWVDRISHIGCCIDSYYEYLLKGAILFDDRELREAWDLSKAAIDQHIAEEVDSALWFAQVNKETGELVNRTVTLYDAYFPAVLCLAGDLENAARYQDSWNSLWLKYGLEPMVYDYGKQEILHPAYNLNPEIIESAYYLYHFTGDKKYKEMAFRYYNDILAFCRTDVAFTNIQDVRTKAQKDHMETFFLAETMKYLYLVFADPEGINPDACVFSTEAHPFFLN